MMLLTNSCKMAASVAFVLILLSGVPSPVQGFTKELKPVAVTPLGTTTSLHAKNIVICCDGTGKDLSGISSNVLDFYSSLEQSEKQICYYDSGVGTVNNSGFRSGIGRSYSKAIDSAFGYSVEDQAEGAFNFLADQWEPGDRIYLLGFSRGAYSVRVLAAMIYRLGLVRKEHKHLIRMGWKHFLNRNWKAMATFKKTFSRSQEIDIHFCGVWDTVSSFGVLFLNPKYLPNTANNKLIRHIRHAVSIDEKRAGFKSNLFFPTSVEQHDSFEQIYFAGVHGDVGGGLKTEGLSKIALKWMFDESRELNCLLDEEKVKYYLGETSDDESKPDPLAPCHNSMVFPWQALEFIPGKRFTHKGEKWFGPNLFSRRHIQDDARFHESVLTKLAEDPNYRPSNVPKAIIENAKKSSVAAGSGKMATSLP